MAGLLSLGEAVLGTFRPLAHGAGSISETIPSTDTQVANLLANQTEVAAATPSASGSIGTGYWSMSTEELANRGLAERAESDNEQNNGDITMTLDVDDEVDDVYVDELQPADTTYTTKPRRNIYQSVHNNQLISISLHKSTTWLTRRIVRSRLKGTRSRRPV